MYRFVATAALAFVAISAATAQQNPNQPAQAKVRKPGKQRESSLSHCLPVNVKLDDVVSTKVVGDIRPENVVRTTVEQTLGGLGAVCKNAKLKDASGKEIYFHHRVGCWGNPPQNYSEILQKQQDELDRLKKKYTVVEMTCNPSGMPIR
jgi:hypothetical protein